MVFPDAKTIEGLDSVEGGVSVEGWVSAMFSLVFGKIKDMVKGEEG